MRKFLAACGLMLGIAATAFGQGGWYDFATVSMTDAVTPKLSNRAICYTDGRNISCDNTSTYISTGGLINVGSLQTAGYVSAGTIHTSGTVKVSNTIYADAINVPGGLAAGSVEWANVLSKPVSLTDLIAITPSVSAIIVGTGTTWQGQTGNTARTSLGLGNADAVTFGSITTAGYVNAGLVQASSYVSSAALYTYGTASITTVSATNISGTNVQIGQSTLTCGPAIAGAIRYNSTSNTLQICTGATGWKSLVSGTAGAGTLATLGDVQFTNTAGRDYLRYDAGTSNWVNISESTAMSTTTMVSGWPDAIKCTSSLRGESVLYLGTGPFTDGTFFYFEPYAGSGNAYYIQYASSGAFTTSFGLGTLSNCNVSMVDNYAKGRAFNFIGNAAGATTAVSSTGAVQFNVNNSLAGDTANFFWDDTNNRLGVGISNPSTTLHVVGNIWASGGGAILLSGTSAGLNIYDRSVGTAASVLYRDQNKTALWDAAGNRLVIDNTNGNVGIGTTYPSTSLHVVGANIRVQSSDSAIPRFSIKNTSGLVDEKNWQNYYHATLKTLYFTALNDAENADSPWMTVRRGTGISITNVAFPNGNVGIGTLVPGAKLEVVGTISASDAIQVGQSALACATGISGSIRYSTTSDTLQICTGAGWKSLVSGTAGGGTANLAGLTDVSLTNIASRDYLRYDAGTSKWVNISESAVMSTTTMIPGWPDAIVCTTSTFPTTVFYYGTTSGGVTNYYAPWEDTGGSYAMSFNSTTGAYINDGLFTSSTCNKSIAQLYAAGQAFNFIGSANASNTTTFNDLTDVDTSGAAAGNVIRYNGSSWVVSTSGGGALSQLTDTNLTNIAGRDYLRYDAGTSKWVNVSESTVMSTTTMVANWPDAIKCGNASWVGVFLLDKAPLISSGNKYQYSNAYAGSSDAGVRFNSNGTFDSDVGITTTDCHKTISQLYADGQAFNFIGSATASNTTALGDRITSGTLAMIANSATSYISLSTAGSVWGYLGAGASYLPTIASNYVSASGVSVSGVVQVSGSGLTCSAAIKGAIRFSSVSNTLEYCTSVAWTAVGNSSDSSLTAFTVTKTGNQALATLGTVVTWEAAITNNGNAFDLSTERFTAPATGLYYFHASLMTNNDGSSGDFKIYKNGTGTGLRAFGVYGAGSHKPAVAQGVLYLIAGDYIDVRSNAATQSLYGNTNESVTTFSGFLLNTGSGTSAGGATTLDGLTDVDTSGAAAGNVIRYNGSSWVVSTSGGGALSQLTDTNITNIAGRDYLRYDSVSSKWVNISESTVMSTTTMVPGWPDAIRCNVTNPAYGDITFFAEFMPYSGDGSYYYRNHSSGGNYDVIFSAAGAFVGYSAMTTTNCGSKSIAQLYAAGQAFNFIGSAASGAAALGDRITSGTLAMTANSATSYISLSTSGSVWGYLGAGASYLPQMNAITVSSSVVSATAISATYIQIQSATTVLACGANLTGTMRYTSGTMQVCNGSSWGNIGIGIPTGTIAAFAATSCPNGWSEYTAGRGRFLRGIDNGASIDPSGTRAPGNTQEDTLQNFTGNVTTIVAFATTNQTGVLKFTHTGGGTGYTGANQSGDISIDASRMARTSTETRPKNVAVIFCQYSGFESALSAGVATLASLSDVSVAGAANGQALVYNGASWVPSTTTGASTLNDLTDVDTSGAAAGNVIRYNGSNWVVSTSGGGALSQLTDTNITNLSGRDYLRYDAGTSKWVNISESTVMSTTTMIPGWPDAISCAGPSGTSLWDLYIVDGGTNVYYGFRGRNLVSYIGFSYPSGAYSAYVDGGAGLTNFMTSCASKSIAQLYAAGQAFNFIGNATTGDRITSGTTNVIANAASAYVSLTSGATTWGYFGATSSYLSQLTANTVSGTLVSATNISGTLIQAGQSAATCNAALAGGMRYNATSNTIQVCAGTSGWKSLSSSTTAGVSSLAALTDTNITNLAGRDYLRYDNPTSKWVNVSESTVMSTTTMMPNFPDAVLCNYGASDAQVLVLYQADTGTATKTYVHIAGPAAYRVAFNPDGSYNSGSNQVSTGSWPCLNKSVSQLYASGQAFNFIGGIGSNPAGSAGDIQFNNGGSFTADTGQLFWDATNNRLGIGTGAPITALDVRGVVSVSGTLSGLLMYDRTAGVAASQWYRAAGKTHLFDTDSATNRLTLDNATGYIGINETTPAAQLEISGTEALRLSRTGAANNAFVSWYNGATRQAYMGYGVAGSAFSLAMENNNALQIIASTTYVTGNAGIGTSTPTAKLDVAGNISATGGISATGSVQAYSFLHPSDRRLKDNIQTIPHPDAILEKLRGTHFKWKSNGEFAYGLIAQEVEEVMPEAVRGGASKTVDYDQLTAVLVQGWKNHQKSIQALQAANDNLRRELKAANDNQQKALEDLERRINKLRAGSYK